MQFRIFYAGHAVQVCDTWYAVRTFNAGHAIQICDTAYAVRAFDAGHTMQVLRYGTIDTKYTVQGIRAIVSNVTFI